MSAFKLTAPFKPTGDQPHAIDQLEKGIEASLSHQVLLGVTGSGKTFTMANLIERLGKPTLIISHNKTLAAQLYQEFRDFFPGNRVEYFVSYYDYYQPEAYVPARDLYIEKEADINQEIDRLRLSSTTSLLTHTDTIVVASVSCIYNLGSPEEYASSMIELKTGMKISPQDASQLLHNQHYTRSDYDLRRSTFRIKGDTLDVHLSYQDQILRLTFKGNLLTGLKLLEPVSGKLIEELENFVIYPAKHYLTSDERLKKGLINIQADLKTRLIELRAEGKALEAYRLEQRTNYDLELIEEIGYCNGIENYSRYFDNRLPGSAPYTLIDFFKSQHKGDFLTIIDESHITIPQIGGMYNGDRSRKQTLVDFGFRLPSALDNRPLNFSEFEQEISQMICVSATPGDWELEKTRKAVLEHRKNVSKPSLAVSPHGGVVEQLIRPTGILDPEIEIRPTANQIIDLCAEIELRVKKRERVLVTTLTKRMAEDLSLYLTERDIKGAYLHSDVATLERLDILDDLRSGKYDVLVGINLLREGLDLPEVSLVAILDADKEGFLRSETSLIQTMGRAARHIDGHVLMYADKITGSMQRAIDEVMRRRQIQLDYNKLHNITPIQIEKSIRSKLIEKSQEVDDEIKEHSELYSDDDIIQMLPKQKQTVMRELNKLMKDAAHSLQFEEAAKFRDEIKRLEKTDGLE
ncbi:excinuclease ABC subunit B [candidate division WWE3 bacterium RIFCSPLOWO2_01_FULL_42_11]|uniref:UvrABC system protein B n=1 Tax=candidate division WWE3 bacterium RIFCSPLOWO2_01_FULL_42_11 TaxID=1802627 RepID=A0A1F4VP51_UNCKA|nr:MAG: excinuclease ABC subunit B [candidate division WWE3 bacterium RIFCSPLOWO2_01_FULL_42_11]